MHIFNNMNSNILHKNVKVLGFSGMLIQGLSPKAVRYWVILTFCHRINRKHTICSYLDIKLVILR